MWCDDTSRMMREYHVRICEGLGVKFPGSTRQQQPIFDGRTMSVFAMNDRSHCETTASLFVIASL